jgi:hypothetical protein
MYSQERELKKLRSIVHNKARIEVCIAEAFTCKDIINFSSMYFSLSNNVKCSYNAVPYSKRCSIE